MTPLRRAPQDYSLFSNTVHIMSFTFQFELYNTTTVFG